MIYQHVDFTKKFIKQYNKLPSRIQNKFNDRLVLFQNEPYNPSLRNHAVKGKYLGYRSINVTGDMRALYYIDGQKIVIFAFIGSHSELY